MEDSGGGGGGEDANDKNKAEAVLALAEIGRSLDSIPSDLASAIVDGRVPASIVHRYLNLEKSAVFRWLLQFGGFKERLLNDDLFLAKVGIECGVGIFTKTAAEYEQRRENFMNELDFVVADVILCLYGFLLLLFLSGHHLHSMLGLLLNSSTTVQIMPSRLLWVEHLTHCYRD